ncbi:hypothetical protein BDF20DRAFT_860253 [Mycotypha africana]|uniref:uncharacterized protein n=1 Tax=Mycotypha africana TaxID=64632 RepID=UPI0023017F8E|nr:uncharacterized protein BDF20DRAFT_860253 [Mycotypha africana]KAI8984484.1 hypothetical protein BDF20DRAFT_860253 [Mycotypha africana]
MLPSKRETVDSTASWFSADSNLMNYSIPKQPLQQQGIDEAITFTTSNSPLINRRMSIADNGSTKREIQSGDADTRTRQLEAQIESLTLQNVKLQRTNRLLKVDTDDLIKQKTDPLEKTIQELTIANVKLQRTARLLQQEVDEKTKELNKLKEDHIIKMKSVGPEYEFLVQNINLLQRQIAGQPICEDTCCFTMQPIDQSTMVMTLPSTTSSSASSLFSSSSEREEPERDHQDFTESLSVEAQHICRPVIHSTVSQGSYASELEKRIIGLQRFIEDLDLEKEQILKQQSYKDNDIETLKRELRIKDEIVSQLEQDFMGMEDQLEQLQKELQEQSTYSSPPSIHRPDSTASTATTMIALTGSRSLSPPTHKTYSLLSHASLPNDPQRQSQRLMESKRKSLAIKDVHLLEEMLKDDLQEFDGGRPSSFDSQNQRISFVSAAESFTLSKDIVDDSTHEQYTPQEATRRQSAGTEMEMYFMAKEDHRGHSAGHSLKRKAKSHWMRISNLHV